MKRRSKTHASLPARSRRADRHRVQEAEPDAMGTVQFLRGYLTLTEEIIKAVEGDQFQRAWLLTKERDRFCRRKDRPEFRASSEDGDSQTHALDRYQDAVGKLFAEAQEADRRCIQLIGSKLDTIRRQLCELHTFRRWNVSRRVPPGPESRLINAAG